MAELLEVATVAFWLARDAHLAAVVDKLVRKRDPAILRDDPHQLLLYLLRRVTIGKAQPMGNSEDMGVNYDTFCLAEADAEDDIGRLAGRAGNGDQFGKGLRHLAVEFGDNLRCGTLDRFGLVAKEACRANQRLKLRQSCFGHRLWGGESTKELWRHHVHTHVGALGGEDGRYQQFPRRCVSERALDVGVGFVEAAQNGGDALGGKIATGLAAPRRRF